MQLLLSTLWSGWFVSNVFKTKTKPKYKNAKQMLQYVGLGSHSFSASYFEKKIPTLIILVENYFNLF